MWKERLWQVLLVAILGLSLTMCSRTGSNNNTPVANAGPSAISHVMVCAYSSHSVGNFAYSSCDACDDTVLSDGEITHDAAFAAGWKLVGSACSTGNLSRNCALFHK